MKLHKKKIIILGSLFLLLGIFFATKLFTGKEKIEYVKIAIKKNPLLVTIQATGNVEPMNKVEILPPVPGRIDSIAIEEGDLVEQGKIIASMSSTNRAALLDIARSRNPGEYKEWEEMYQPTPIIAPVTGRIISKKIVPGQTVGTQSVLFEMSDKLVIRAQVDETDIEKIKPGMDAVITVDAYPNKNFGAHVDKISHQSELINNVNIYSVELVLYKQLQELRSGMTANVHFIIKEKESALVIPVWAVQGREEEDFTVLDKNKKPKILSLGLSDGQNVEILSPIQEGEEIFVQQFQFKSKNGSTSPFSPFGGGRGKRQK
ncbi:MAG: efflux RND transporter periplasmic adaptor subunit [Deltaproteobacteria bacterium]|nr:efflux RND transporter periplasmic adaptor subunit [Deltaproteobacteria bacterium]